MRSIRLMATQTLRILLRCRRTRFGAEVDHTRERAAARFHVRAAGAMAGLALQTAMAERPAGVIRARMLGAKDADDAGIGVTGEAGIGAVRTVRSRGRGGCGRRRLIGGERRHDCR